MRFEFENFKDTWSEEIQPAFGLWWFYFNGKPKRLVKRNAYRARVGLPQILDEGSYCFFRISFGSRFVGLHIEIRKSVYEKLVDKLSTPR